MANLIKCKRCLSFFDESNFSIKKKTGKHLLQCNYCRNYVNEWARLHSKRNKKCEHGRRRDQCKECGGSGICEHKRRRSECKECGGSQICEHEKIRSKCKECGGSQICQHDRRRDQCKECNNPIEITIKGWIRSSRKRDKDTDRYDANNFIDKCFLDGLIEDTGKICYYCKKDMQYLEKNESLATIERLNNSIGHIKSNCVICCFKCNMKHHNNGLFGEFAKTD